MAILLAAKLSTLLHRKYPVGQSLPERPGYCVFSRQELKEAEGKVHVWEAGVSLWEK